MDTEEALDRLPGCLERRQEDVNNSLKDLNDSFDDTTHDVNDALDQFLQSVEHLIPITGEDPDDDIDDTVNDVEKPGEDADDDNCHPGQHMGQALEGFYQVDGDEVSNTLANCF